MKKVFFFLSFSSFFFFSFSYYSLAFPSSSDKHQPQVGQCFWTNLDWLRFNVCLPLFFSLSLLSLSQSPFPFLPFPFLSFPSPPKILPHSYPFTHNSGVGLRSLSEKIANFSHIGALHLSRNQLTSLPVALFKNLKWAFFSILSLFSPSFFLLLFPLFNLPTNNNFTHQHNTTNTTHHNHSTDVW